MIHQEIIVDGFAGGGGASTGIERALNRSPDIAINHDAVAIAMHYANHQDTLHVNSNIWKVDPKEVCKGRPVGLAWFSPDCKHFSKAKGGKPVEKNIRDLAWVVTLWAQQVKPRIIILENVEEFRTWGPLAEDGRPCPLRKGETFTQWLKELRRCGYQVEWRELVAADYGAPTIRKRLFLIARCDDESIVWPKPTHANPKKVPLNGKQPWRTAAEIIDWSLPCPSIFLTKEEAKAIGARRPLADATMARIAKGVKRYVLDAADPFIVNITHKSGNGEARTEPLDEPLRTVTGAHRGEKALITPFIARTAHGDVDKNGKRRGKGQHDATEPLPTQTQSPDFAVVSPIISSLYSERNKNDPRCARPDDPLATVTATPRHAVIAPHVMTMRNAQKPFNGADQPTHTITAEGAHLHLVSAFLAQHNGGMVGHEAKEPVSTLSARGAQQAIVSAGMVNLKGSDRRGSGPDEPLRTVTSKGFHHAEVRAFLIKYFGTQQDPQMGEPLHTATTKDRFGLVYVHGEPYQIVDIGMRMLTPRELFRAQGFGDDYIIDKGLFALPDGSNEWRPITKTDQVSKCGNSVCPTMAEALVRANFVPREIFRDETPSEFYLEAAE